MVMRYFFFKDSATPEIYTLSLPDALPIHHTAGLPLYPQVSRGDCLLHLSEHHGDGTPGTKLRIECDDVEAYHEGLRAKEYQYFNPHLGKQPWAKWELRLTDPFGNELIFYQAQ